MPDDELDDRLSRRFEDAQDGEESAETDDSQNNMSSTPDQKNEKAQTSQSAQNIKKEWNVRSFYLDDDLDDRLTTAFKRLDLNVSEADEDIDLKKTRHFYPLLVALGLDHLEDMDVAEVSDVLEREELQ